MTSVKLSRPVFVLGVAKNEGDIVEVPNDLAQEFVWSSCGDIVGGDLFNPNEEEEAAEAEARSTASTEETPSEPSEPQAPTEPEAPVEPTEPSEPQAPTE